MEMRIYELSLVLTKEVKVEELLKKVKAKIIKTNVLGLRQLAYKIKSNVKGWYVFMDVELEENLVSDLNKLIENDDAFIRYLLVVKG